MPKSSNLRFASFAVVAAAAIAVGAPASAAAADQSVQVPVSYRDLNVNSDAGAKVLLQRIQAAASFACGGQPDIRELAQRTRFDACRQAAVESAVSRVGSPMLIAMLHKSSEPVVVAVR